MFAISRCTSGKTLVPRKQLAGAGRWIVYHKGIPNFEKASDSRGIFMLDDLLNEVYSRKGCELFTKTINRGTSA